MAGIVCVLCMCVDDTGDKVKQRVDGGTVSRETTCGKSLADFLFFLGLDNVIMCNLAKKRVIVLGNTIIFFFCKWLYSH